MEKSSPPSISSQGCSTGYSLFDEKDGDSPFAFSHTILSSLLCFWPLGQTTSSSRTTPSLLLCGESGCGKSYVWKKTVSFLREERRRVQFRFSGCASEEKMQIEKSKRHNFMQFSSSITPSLASFVPPEVVVIQPSLSKASLYASSSNSHGAYGLTPLRRLLQKEVYAQCRCDNAPCVWLPSSGSNVKNHEGKKLEGEDEVHFTQESSQKAKGFFSPRSSSTSSGKCILVVLDHLELFCLGMEECDPERDPTEMSTVNGLPSTTGKTDGLSSSSVFPHASLLTDICTLLKDSPPLFSPEELMMLGIQRVVVVGAFSGVPENVPPVVRRSFSTFVHLSTPVEKERFDFFMRYISADSLSEGATQTPLDSEVHPRHKASSFQDSPFESADEREVAEKASKRKKALIFSRCLASALALRSGGITYQGLTEIVRSNASLLSFSPLPWWNEFEILDGASQSQETTVSALITPTRMTQEESSCGSSQHFCSPSSYYRIFSFAQHIVQEFQQSHSIAASQFRSRSGYVDVQVTRWNDIAGLHEAKKELQQTALRPLKFESIYRQFGVRPSTGILLYGPPGTGKTMLAKAMATELNASFVYMDLPALIKAEVGESERRLSDFFAVAKERSPAVLFMDELQAAFGVRYSTSHMDPTTGCKGNWSAATHHESRLVSHFLQCMDQAREDWTACVVVVGATNVIHQLDPLLLRAGRLDTHIRVPLPDEEARTELIRRVVYGEWSSWFAVSPSTFIDGDGSKVSSTDRVNEERRKAWSLTLSLKGIPILREEQPLPLQDHKKQESRTPFFNGEVNSWMSASTAVREAVAALQEELTVLLVRHSSQLSGAELRNATTMFAVDYLQFVLLPVLEKELNGNSSNCTTISHIDSNNDICLIVFDSMVETASIQKAGMSLLENPQQDVLAAVLDEEASFDDERITESRTRKNVQVTLRGNVVDCVKKAIQLQRDAKAHGTSYYE